MLSESTVNMRAQAIFETRVFGLLCSFRTLFTVQLLILGVWTVKIFPALLQEGLAGALLSLDNAAHPISAFLFLVFSGVWVSICLIRLVSELFSFRVNSFDFNSLILDQVNQNAPLQFFIILLGRYHYTCSELLVCAYTLLFYSLMRFSSAFVAQQLKTNTSVKFFYLNLAVSLCVLICIPLLLYSVQEVGLSILSYLQYEAVFVLKNCYLSHCVLSRKKEMSLETEMKLSMAENLLKLVQWGHLGVLFSDIIPTNPGNIFLFLKIQQYFLNLTQATKKFKEYKSTVRQFLKSYPPLSLEALASLEDNSCCICLETLQGDCSKLTCSHIFHVVCICRWTSAKQQKRCPLCHQVFLTKEAGALLGLDVFNSGIESVVRRVQEVLPQIPEEEIRRELQITGNVNAAIDNLLLNL